MSVLPIVDRELRVAARRPLVIWGRCFPALASLGLLLIFLQTRSPILAGALRIAAFARTRLKRGVRVLLNLD